MVRSLLSGGTQKLSCRMALRAWWWYSRPSEKWPREVKEYIVRRAIKQIRSGAAKNASPEEKTKGAVGMIARALTIEAGDISEELRGDLLEEA